MKMKRLFQLLFLLLLVWYKLYSDWSLEPEPVKAASLRALTSYGHPPWLRECRKIYLDVGSNIGVQVRKFFEPERYPGAEVLPLFDRSFGPAARRKEPSQQTGLCSLGMEPHPALQGRLHEIAQAYQSRGWHVHFYPFAAHTRVGTLLFQQQDGVGRGTASRIAGYGPKSWWPFSWEDRSQQVTVQTIDLADFISSLPASSVVLMKLDIEGAEFDVVPRLAERGLLCKSSIPEAFIEVHESSKFSIAAGERFIEQQLDLARNSEGPCEHTVLNVLDDESFAKDVDHDFAGRTKAALRLSPEDGHSYMFGYFDKWAVDESNQRVLACRIPYADQEPSESAEMVVGFVPMDGTQQFTELGKTTAWNLQQGAMAEWLGPQTVIFNIRNSGGDGKSLFQAQVVDAKSGETWLYPRPVYALNRPRDRFLSLSFQRLHWLYRGYGYTIPDSVPEKIPEDDGLWEVDLGSQHEELLISVRGLYDFLQLTGRTDPITGEAFAEDPENAISGYWYLNHAHVSSEGSKVAFLFRSAMTLFSDSFDFTSLILMDLSSRELWRVPKVHGSHHFFGGFLVSCDALGTFEVEFKASVRQLSWQKGTDGHCNLSPDNEWILTDTYPDAYQLKKVLVEERRGESVYLLGYYREGGQGPSSTRCDLHPHWDRFGCNILFDSTHKDSLRAVYRLDLDAFAFPGCTAKAAGKP